ncbi:carboxypeptidase-like regulatory domain-containing protein [Seonamhaeicola marinus]|uniref:carboxypeptidase-like regulatory domain-containing protein n=1 Tax=Seonamhaeicola marinus TaxID=1912246 RepID=UPI001FE2AA73|nr:carboxypeptidase-like regulatory domain-containing protein [Seonamhaeicola marinus]
MFSQTVEISGKVISKTDLENIHVINKTAQVFTITNARGEFTITAKVNDTLQFSSIQLGIKSIVVNKGAIISKKMLVPLDEQINELEEVVVGKVLTGNLLSDIENADTDRPINFYDVGIPGYKGKIATQSERRLFEANGQKIKWYTPLTGAIPLNPILNGISGRTKLLKERVKLENDKNLIRKIKSEFSEGFFSNHQLEDDLKDDFFFFCQEDINFTDRCKGKSDLEILEFLNEKYKHYIKNLQSTD